MADSSGVEGSVTGTLGAEARRIMSDMARAKARDADIRIADAALRARCELVRRRHTELTARASGPSRP